MCDCVLDVVCGLGEFESVADSSVLCGSECELGCECAELCVSGSGAECDCEI